MELVLFSPLSSGIPGVSIQVPESVRALGTAAPGVVVSYPTESRTRDLLYQVSHGQTLNRSLFTLSNEKEEDFWRAVESEPVDLEALKSAGYRYLLVQDHVGERTDPHRRVALSLEERLTVPRALERRRP